MEHQDTKLTSMRPRLKELNDNPYLANLVELVSIQRFAILLLITDFLIFLILFFQFYQMNP